MFAVFPPSSSFSNTFNLLHLESPTYNCPCENTGVLKSYPMFLRAFPLPVVTPNILNTVVNCNIKIDIYY